MSEPEPVLRSTQPQSTVLRRPPRLAILREFVRGPTAIGAISPSSEALAHAMLRAVDLDKMSTVLEFGAGTGALSGHILRSLPSQCRFLAWERNNNLAQMWRLRHPTGALYEADVEDCETICKREGIRTVDAVFSSLPWASFDDGTQDRLLDLTTRLLGRTGVFVTVGYTVGTLLPRGRRFYSRLEQRFRTVKRSRYVLMNLPPAFVVRCS